MSIQVGKSWRVEAVTACVVAHRSRTKHFIVAIVALAATALASPAMAYVVELTTSIDLTDVTDKAQLRQAVESAVEDVLATAISFSPTLITGQNVRVVGDRMYLLLLIVDAAVRSPSKRWRTRGPRRPIRKAPSIRRRQEATADRETAAHRGMMNGTPQNGGPDLPATAGQPPTTERKTDMARAKVNRGMDSETAQ